MQIKRFLFESALKRMSAIVNIDDGKGNGDYRVLCKGAPEIIQKYLETVPKGYEKGYL